MLKISQSGNRSFGTSKRWQPTTASCLLGIFSWSLSSIFILTKNNFLLRIFLSFVWMTWLFTIDFLQHFGTDLIAKRDFFALFETGPFFVIFRTKNLIRGLEIVRKCDKVYLEHYTSILTCGKGRYSHLKSFNFFIWLTSTFKPCGFLKFNYSALRLHSESWAVLVVPEQYLGPLAGSSLVHYNM